MRAWGPCAGPRDWAQFPSQKTIHLVQLKSRLSIAPWLAVWGHSSTIITTQAILYKIPWSRRFLVSRLHFYTNRTLYYLSRQKATHLLQLLLKYHHRTRYPHPTAISFLADYASSPIALCIITSARRPLPYYNHYSSNTIKPDTRDLTAVPQSAD